MKIEIPLELETLLTPALMAAAEPVTVGKGLPLFRQRQKPRFMHFVVTGEVLLQRMDEQGAALVLQRVRRGFVAEASLQALVYHCDAIAATPSQLVRLPLADLRMALASDARFSQKWISMLSAELRQARLQCERLSLKGVGERLVHLIRTEGAQGRLPMASGLKSLAGDLAVTHEALYRAVAALEREGRLQRVDGHLVWTPPGQPANR
ncbi:putative Dnr-like transcriptional activator [Hydrogenophaga taeniospiralis CCUG 15921]|uniref:Dnr-like transcriptional activator n=1 Tax=Hydrogenophaga taeniospiralis CCUG 15921 TaxID=1281780 RepID=A0A9X4NWK7_9BURK|nr:Crp/Fnr family transcriptional regulator [Hydrogenophaga taeniospiralis]MDG5977996.1 putative Dnr-like transcriptional activator [Hydrogenophaga taeniospiralis CCUG 15921]